MTATTMCLSDTPRTLPELRDYQRAAIRATYEYCSAHPEHNACIVIPTGGGKTHVIAAITRHAIARGRRVLILSHVRELLTQIRAALEQWDIGAEAVGVYCAGLGRKDTDQPVILASAQSLYRHADRVGVRHLILVDEAHLIPRTGDGQFRSIIFVHREQYPSLRVIGFTATPYRLDSGMIVDPDDDECILDAITYEVSVRDLIEQGYLSPLTSRAAVERANYSGARIRQGEYVTADIDRISTEGDLVRRAVAEMLALTSDRRAILVFACGRLHANMIAEEIGRQTAEPAGVILGDTPAQRRAELIAQFRERNLRWLVSCQVLTLGFDAPHVDAVALMRPTLSPGLYYQMVGRGLRRAEGKQDCLVLDYGNNVLRHGPIDSIRPPEPRTANGDDHERARQRDTESDGERAWECRKCHALMPIQEEQCLVCGAPRSRPIRHDACAADVDVLRPRELLRVERIDYAIHQPRDGRTATLRVTYYLERGIVARQWIAFDRENYSRIVAERWWRRRCAAPVPRTAADAYRYASAGVLREPRTIVASPSQYRWWDVITTDLDEVK